MQWFKMARYLDFSFGAVSLIYGLLSHSMPWIVGGLLGLGIAFVNPAQRLCIWMLGIKRARR